MTTAQLNLFVSLSALEPLPDSEERCRVPCEVPGGVTVVALGVP